MTERPELESEVKNRDVVLVRSDSSDEAEFFAPRLLELAMAPFEEINNRLFHGEYILIDTRYLKRVRDP